MVHKPVLLTRAETMPHHSLPPFSTQSAAWWGSAGRPADGGWRERERAAGHTLLNPLRAALCFQRLNLNEERDTGLLPPLCSHSQGIWKSGRLTGKSPYDPNVIQDPHPDSPEQPPNHFHRGSVATKWERHSY